ncbi:hypothetical protein NG791_16990 [Laspinema sp. D1]|uniref:calcium-binding protein n=1 Tax=Laspinema palackyanum TaxID=3231601 RepID=UPI003471DBF4|nr:hypothetical protein [Laspinema sp. D2b]
MVRILDTNPLNPNDTLDLFAFGLGADTVLGKTGTDFITSDSVGGSFIFGNTENDSLTSSGPGDTLYGGKDDDFLVSKAGGSVFFGDLGQDRFEARGDNHRGADTVYGGTNNQSENREEDGDDIFNFGNGRGGNLAFGNGGDDFISGSGFGADTLYGGIGDDTIQVIEIAGDGSGASGGGAAFVPDTVAGIGFIPPSTSGGGSGAGVGVVLEAGVPIPRNPGRNYLSGDKGNDVIFGIGDRDSLIGGEGNDSLFMLSAKATGELGLSPEGQNTVVGARRELAGFPRNNLLDGGTGSDYIYSYGGDRGRQTMTGAEGDDSLFNRGSQVLVFGNTGVDYLETTGFTRSTLYGGQDNDTVVSGFSLVTGSTATVGGGTNLLYGDKGNDTMLSTGVRDTLYGGNIEDNDTIAGNNLDRLSLGGASSIGFGNQGNDTLIGAAGFVSLYGGQDNDFITASGANSYLSGDKGLDTLVLGLTATNSTLIGGEGNDSLYARNGGGKNLLMAVSGDNVLVAGKSDDTLMGGSGNDFLVGSVDADTLRGDSPGLDTLEGFKGADSLIGTVGATDGFLYASFEDGGGIGATGDTITTFEKGTDKLYLSRSGFAFVPEAASGLRTGIDFFSVGTNETYSGTFTTIASGQQTPAIIFDAQDQGGFLLWDFSGAQPAGAGATLDIVTLAVVATGTITRDDIVIF